ncbi:MAG TPA: hypothetical protein DCL41_00270 [Bdellovibrionales bacterium]|nr:hypothetical protein [Bdellovibrionales bacterium]
MRLLTAKECNEWDQILQEKLHLSGELLMESVAGQMAVLLKNFALKKKIHSFRILCGPGNNGADGLALARLLLSMDFKVECFASEQGKTSKLFEEQKNRFQSLNGKIHGFESFKKFPLQEAPAILVDALFGVGFRGELESPFKEVVQRANQGAGIPVALDVPSGLNVDSGVASGEVFRAQYTLTVGTSKPGFYTADGPTCCGKIKVISSSFHKDLMPKSSSKFFLKQKEDVKNLLPEKGPRSHKGSIGKLHLVVGSKKYLGAAKLVVDAALSAGASYLYVYGDSLQVELLKDAPEIIFRSSVDFDPSKWDQRDAAVIGPGVSDVKALEQMLQKLKQSGTQKVLLDAGAFQVLKSGFSKVPDSWILTPHPGELGDLLETSAKHVEQNRFQSVLKAQGQFGGQILLKGFLPLLATSSLEVWSLPFGDQRLGKAGSGDALAGLVGGLMVQMDSVSDAMALGVYLHARSAELQTKGVHPSSLQSSKISNFIGCAMKELESKSQV